MATFFKSPQTPEDALLKVYQDYQENVATLEQVAAAHPTPVTAEALELVRSQLQKLEAVKPVPDTTPIKPTQRQP